MNVASSAFASAKDPREVKTGNRGWDGSPRRTHQMENPLHDRRGRRENIPSTVPLITFAGFSADLISANGALSQHEPRNPAVPYTFHHVSRCRRCFVSDETR